MSKLDEIKDGTVSTQSQAKHFRVWAVLKGSLRTLTILGVGFVLFVLIGWQLLPRVELPSFIKERMITRTQPVVLEAVQDLARFEAATGSFTVVVDSQKQRELIGFVKVNEGRIVWVGAGSVSAYVDFSRLNEKDITVSEDRTSVSMRIPHAELGDVDLDLNPDRSYYVLDGTGEVLTTNPDSSSYLEVQRLSEARLAEAAIESELIERAENNTQMTLEGILHALGFGEVSIIFV